eukprot:TRINITY_DN1238_c0_g1_i1.p1 TRINITY_DN1238_c0_g1~~TRINITY_DN1238_c0_g1_i1.p1  ORF type:complete len:309 (+),score=40.51 TRINITY_DN1238_c0_g1_i1:270-1196(+)
MLTMSFGYYCCLQCQKDDWNTHKSECADQQEFLKVLAGKPHATMADVLEDNDAMRRIAQYYFAGANVVNVLDPRLNRISVKNPGIAFFWVRKLAKTGDPDGMEWLGEMFLDGECVAEDKVEAVKWFKKAATTGEPRAQFHLADAYRLGAVVNHSPSQAYRLYRLAAEQGHVASMHAVGKCFSDGSGVARNDEREAVKWYRKAAEKDHPKAMNNYANRLLRGIGVAQDEVEGMRWIDKAVAKNDSCAQWTLGLYYLPQSPYKFPSPGREADERRGMELIRLSASQGHPMATKFLQMPPEIRNMSFPRSV